MSWFSNKTDYKMVFTGKVKFVHDGQLLEGKIFGQPIPSVSTYYYNILIGDKAYFVPEWNIEQL